MESLKESTLWDNTVAIVASTNGGIQSRGSYNYPYRGGKFTFLDKKKKKKKKRCIINRMCSIIITKLR